MASLNPALPLDSHVQSYAEVLENKLCEFPRSLKPRAIAGVGLPLLTAVTGGLSGSQIHTTSMLSKQDVAHRRQ